MSLHLSSQRLIPLYLAVVACLIVLTSVSTASANQGAHPAYYHADTWNNIHPFLMFDGYISNPASIASRYDFVTGAKWYNVAAYRSANPNIFLTYYITFHRDNGAFTDSSALQTLAGWRAVHPDWVLYKCNRVTPAYEFDNPNIPLDFSNPALVNWQVQNYAVQASQSGYDGITVDNLNLENLFGACGTYKNGKWVQLYNGKHDDPKWRADVLSWITQMQAALHNLPHPLALILNLGYSQDTPPTDPLIQQVISHSDGVLDEAGFTHYGTSYLTDQYWNRSIQLSEIVQAQGKPFYVVDTFPSLNRANVQWALASYLMAKEHSSGLFVSTFQNYGIEAWQNEYNVQIGAPTDAMHQSQNVYFRDYSKGLSIVNPSSRTTYKISLNPAVKYVDMYGNSVSKTVSMPPHSGLVLLLASQSSTH